MVATHKACSFVVYDHKTSARDVPECSLLERFQNVLLSCFPARNLPEGCSVLLLAKTLPGDAQLNRSRWLHQECSGCFSLENLSCDIL